MENGENIRSIRAYLLHCFRLVEMIKRTNLFSSCFRFSQWKMFILHTHPQSNYKVRRITVDYLDYLNTFNESILYSQGFLRQFFNSISIELFRHSVTDQKLGKSYLVRLPIQIFRGTVRYINFKLFNKRFYIFYCASDLQIKYYFKCYFYKIVLANKILDFHESRV